jgi:hypothetical protein
MYWNQSRFEKREGKYPLYFRRRPGFSDAFEYLRFTSETIGEKNELRTWWKEFIKTHPLTPALEKQVQASAEKRRKPPRRRRRRGGKERTGTKTPNI